MGGLTFNFITVIGNTGVILILLYIYIQKRNKENLFKFLFILFLFIKNVTLAYLHQVTTDNYPLEFILISTKYLYMLFMILSIHSLYKTKMHRGLLVIFTLYIVIDLVSVIFIDTVVARVFNLILQNVLYLKILLFIYNQYKRSKDNYYNWYSGFISILLIYFSIYSFIDLMIGSHKLFYIIDSIVNSVGGTYLILRLVKEITETNANSEKKQCEEKLLNYGISFREKEILPYLIKGMQYKEIAQILNISPITVKKHAANIYKKTGIKGKKLLQQSELKLILE